MSKNNKDPKRVPHNLEAVARRELGIELDKEHQKADWASELSPDMLEYAATDARVLLPLADVLETKAADAGLERVLEIEHRALPAMAWMAGAGVPFDSDGWGEHLKRVVRAEVGRLRGELDALAPGHPGGGTRNWNSPQQTKEAFALAGVDLPDTSKKTLSRCPHPLAKALLAYRKASKVVGTYGPGLLERVRPDGRIYASWRQIGTATGRMSCKAPNLQQLPKDALRRHVRAPEGRAIVAADYAQAELRILAEASGEPALVGAFGAGKDPYKATAAGMFGVQEEVTTEQRSAAKGINLSIIYGKTPHGLAEDLGLGVREARNLMGRYFGAHPKVNAYLKLTATEALATGVGRTPAGRTRRFGDVAALRGSKRRTVERKAKNFPMQGGCTDGLKLALALLFERRHERPGAFPIACVHDEILVECAEREVEKVGAWLGRAMKDGMAGALDAPGVGGPRVPIGVEVKSGKTWDG